MELCLLGGRGLAFGRLFFVLFGVVLLLFVFFTSKHCHGLSEAYNIVIQINIPITKQSDWSAQAIIMGWVKQKSKLSSITISFLF